MAKEKLKDEDMKEKITKAKVLKIFQDMELKETQCTLGCYSPRWAQRLATKKVYLFVYCIVGLFLGAYFTYTVSTISTIEKRFKLTSKHIGLVLSGNDISQIILSTFVTHWGNHYHRPKLVGIGVIAASVACLLSATPHFMYGPGEDALLVIDSLKSNVTISGTQNTQSKLSDFCYDPLEQNCGEGHQGPYWGAMFVLFCAQFFVGLTVMVFYSIGFVYLDDNVSKDDSPIYYSTTLIVRTMGPVCGYLLGSQFLKLYVDPVYRPNISLRDPRWLGAWWLGYLFLGGILLLLGFTFMLFPKILPTTFYKKVKSAHATESQGRETLSSVRDFRYYIELANVTEKHIKPSLKNLPIAIKRVCTNKLWIGHTLNTVLYLLALLGYWSFKSKFMEFQFRQSASAANFFTGLVSLFASVLGIGISGIVLKVYKPKPRLIAGYAIILTIFSSATMLGLMTIGCKPIDVQGPASWSPDLGSCNTDCGCSSRYSPVCGEDGKTVYHSPCYAGCTTVDESKNPIEYGNCECVKKNLLDDISYNTSISGISGKSVLPIEVEPTFGGKTIQGYCPSDCDAFSTYVIVTVVVKLIDATGRVGGTVLYIRSLGQQDKGLALGISTALMSLFAFIPAPILMGAIVDSACIIWDDTCGAKGNCWLYDSDQFRYLIHAVPAVIILFSVIGDIIVFKNCKDLNLYEDENKKTSHDPKELKQLKLKPVAQNFPEDAPVKS